MHRFQDVCGPPPEDLRLVRTEGREALWVHPLPRLASRKVGPESREKCAGAEQCFLFRRPSDGMGRSLRPQAALRRTARVLGDREAVGSGRAHELRAPPSAIVRPARKYMALSRLGNRAGERRFSAETGARPEDGSVGEAGFEPTTTSTQSSCTTRLCDSPRRPKCLSTSAFARKPATSEGLRLPQRGPRGWPSA